MFGGTSRYTSALTTSYVPGTGVLPVSDHDLSPYACLLTL